MFVFLVQRWTPFSESVVRGDVDIDECAVNNGGCSPLSTCTNTAGSFACICPPGYTADGLSCTGNLDYYTVALTILAFA